MSVWRDSWGQDANVVIIAQTHLTEQGVLEDALLFVLDPAPHELRLTDEHGTIRTFTLPTAVSDGGYQQVGIDLHTRPA